MDHPSIKDSFWHPLTKAISLCTSTRECPALADEQWVRLGISRVIEGSVSGRKKVAEKGGTQKKVAKKVAKKGGRQTIEKRWHEKRWQKKGGRQTIDSSAISSY